MVIDTNPKSRHRAALALACASASVPFATLDANDKSHGPGWFDSSLELMRGLDVREGLPADASLNEWLMAALR